MWGRGWLLALVEGEMGAANNDVNAHHDAAAAAGGDVVVVGLKHFFIVANYQLCKG